MAICCQPPIAVLPGSGINAESVHTIIACPWWKQFREIHLSAGEWINGQMVFRKEDMGMGVGGDREWSVWRSNAEVVRAVKTRAAAAALAEENAGIPAGNLYPS